DLNSAKAPPRSLRRYQRRAGAEKDIKDEIPMTGHILDRIGHHARRLDRRMQCEILPPAAPETVDGRIIPDICSVTAMLAKFHHIQVRGLADAVNKNQLML